MQYKALEHLFEKEVQILTTDNKSVIGTLVGIDHTLNCVMKDCKEIEEDLETGKRDEYPVGLQFFRGDSICLIGPTRHEIGDD